MVEVELAFDGLPELQRKLDGLGKQLRDVEGRITNDTEYAVYVGYKPYQAWMHVGRWATDEDTTAQEEPAIVNDFNSAVVAATAADSVNGNPLLPPMRRAVDRVRRVMATYPPERPGQRYKRTGRYGKNWKTRVAQK